MFILPCKFDKTRPIIFSCVEAIRKYHNDPIVIVDSDSDETQYGEQLQHNYKDVFFEKSKNKNYELGALNVAVEKYDFNYYYLMHDSMLLKSNIDHIKEHNLVSTRYFYSWNGVRGSVFGNLNTGVRAYHYGFDSESSRQTAISWNKNNLNINFPPIFNGVFGSSFYADKNTLNTLIENGIFKSLPNDKLESQTMERYLGILFNHLGFDHSKYSLLGEYHITPPVSQYIEKVTMGRQ